MLKVHQRWAAAAAIAVLTAGSASCSTPEPERIAVPVPTTQTTTPSTTTSTTTTPPSTSTTSTTTKPAIKPGTIPGTGLFTVGVDIQPGTYVSNTPADRMCYGARLKENTSPDPLIANYVTQGRNTVTILKTDVYFETRDCVDWVKS